MALSPQLIIIISCACILLLGASAVIGYYIYTLTNQNNSTPASTTTPPASSSTTSPASGSGTTSSTSGTGSTPSTGTNTTTPPASSSTTSPASGSGTTVPSSGTNGTSTAQAVPTGVYSSYAFTDYNGQGDISSAPGSASACPAMCDAITGCTGFTLNGTTNTCFFKNNTVTTPSYNPIATYYYKGTAPNGPAYGVLQNTDFSGQGDISSQPGNATTCPAICNGTPNCTGFSTDGTTCYLKNNTVITPYYSPTISYYYKGATPAGGVGQNCYAYNQLYGNRYAMYPGDSLQTCGMLKTPDNSHTLDMQPNGNLVLTNINNSKVTWSSGTSGKGVAPYTFTYQSDGNCVIYDSTKTAIWSTGTYQKTSTVLVLQNDGDLVLYNSTPNNFSSDSSVSGSAVWSTGTYNV